MFDIHKTTVIAECWVPKNHVKQVTDIVTLAAASSYSQVEPLIEEVTTSEIHPTYFQTNKFTQVFQDITDAYSVPAYKEVNPAPISMITFPFLFAVMFGDLGHATMLFLVSFAMCVFEEHIRETMETNEILVMGFQGRYLLLLMSIFSIYTGLLYNDVFGLSLNLWGSRFVFDGLGVGTYRQGQTYEFGVDPAWYETTNKLSYYNSLKMKMAIVFGVTHVFFNFLKKRC